MPLSWPDKTVCQNGENHALGDADSERCSLLLVHDLNGDGQLEVVIERRSKSFSSGCCSGLTQQTSYAFYTIENSALRESKRFPTIASDEASLSVFDFDGDGHPDLRGTLDYKIPKKCSPPDFLLHTVPGAGLVRDDAVAKQAARAWCGKPPTVATVTLPSTELAKYVLCARLWGKTPEQVRASLADRCRNTDSVVYDTEGHERHPYPWLSCYHDGKECEYPEIRDFCAPWLQELIDAPPPFRF